MIARYFTRHVLTTILLLVAFICSTELVHAQGERFRKWGVGASFGLATYSMKDLKRYLEEQDQRLPFKPRMVKSFPAYTNVSINISYLDSIHCFDVFVGRTSTGGRLSYADRSGAYARNVVVVMGYSGASAVFRFINTKYIDGFAGMQVFTYVNQVRETVKTEIYGSSAGSGGTTTKYASINVGAAPVFELQNRWSHFAFRFQCAYEAHVGSGLVNEDDQEIYMMDSSGQKLKVDPSGLRLKVGVTYLF